MRKVLLSFSFVVLLFSLGAKNVIACSCIPPKEPREAMADAAAVFRGVVTESTREDILREGFETTTDPYVATFSVSTVWKGDVASTAEVSTALESASCGFNFEIDKEYIVYAWEGESGNLETGLCSRTALITDATEDLEELGNGNEPGSNVVDSQNGDSEDSEENTDEEDSNNYLLIGAGALIAIILIVVVLSLLNKNKTDNQGLNLRERNQNM